MKNSEGKVEIVSFKKPSNYRFPDGGNLGRKAGFFNSLLVRVCHRSPIEIILILEIVGSLKIMTELGVLRTA